jgi:hypothetical protein
MGDKMKGSIPWSLKRELRSRAMWLLPGSSYLRTVKSAEEITDAEQREAVEALAQTSSERED